MQLKITTDYAIRTVLYLARVDRLASSAEVAEEMAIPRKYLINIVGELKREGLVKTHSGQNGGYSLTRPPKEISLYDIIKIMESTTKFNRCLEDDKFCSRQATETCPIHKAYALVQQRMEKTLKEITIEKLLKEL